MNIIIFLLVFLIILFFYIHIFYFYKINNNLEFFEFSICSKERFEEIHDLKQVFILNDINNVEQLKNFYLLDISNILNNYTNYNLNFRNINNFFYHDVKQKYISKQIFNSDYILNFDKENKYISQNNSNFLNETNLINILNENDKFLKPYLLSNSIYDIIIGKTDQTLPLQYSITSRTYFILLNGSVKIKLISPNYTKYLYRILDYDNLEFRSEIDIWNVKDKYKNDIGKIKFIEYNLEPGKLISIPTFWWYSFKFEDKVNNILSLKYETYINNISLIPEYTINFLQKIK